MAARTWGYDEGSEKDEESQLKTETSQSSV
jgi:hypothetical protein